MWQRAITGSSGGGATTHAYDMVWVNSVYESRLFLNGELIKTFDGSNQAYSDDYIDITYTSYSKVTVVAKKACVYYKNYHDPTNVSANGTVINQGNFMNISPAMIFYAE